MEKWTIDEDKLLREVYSTKTKKEIISYFPNRSWVAIRKRARQKVVKRDIEMIKLGRANQLKQTCLLKYGCENPSQLIGVKEKKINSCLSNYGCKNPFQSESIKEKIKQAHLEKYGCYYVSQSEDIKEKSRQTCLTKYGCSYLMQSKDIKEKRKQTYLNKYGHEHSVQAEIVKQKIYETFKKNNSFGKSKEEDNFYEYLLQIDPNTSRQVKHPIVKHIIDFYIPSCDIYCQYDSKFWHGKKPTKKETQRSSSILQTIKRDEFQNENIRNLIRFWDDEVKNSIKNKSILEFIMKTINEKLLTLQDNSDIFF